MLTNYFLKARKKYELTKNIFLNKSLHKLSTYTNIKTIKALFKFNIYQINQTLNQVNYKELKNDYLVQIFNRYATYNGSSPYKTPGMMTLIQHLENNYGTYIPEKGMYDITNSLYELAKTLTNISAITDIISNASRVKNDPASTDEEKADASKAEKLGKKKINFS